MSGEKTNFQFILRLLNTNVDGKQKIMYALTQIKGVGRRYSNLVCKKADVDLSKRYVSTTINDFGINLQCLELGVEFEGRRQGSNGMNYTNDRVFFSLYRLESPPGNNNAHTKDKNHHHDTTTSKRLHSRHCR